MIFNEIKYHVNTSLGLVGDAPPASPLCPRLCFTLWLYHLTKENSTTSEYHLTKDYSTTSEYHLTKDYSTSSE